MYGESGPKVTEQELREDAEIHERLEEADRRRPPWWRRLFRHGGSER
jgi:hypothetical protein